MGKKGGWFSAVRKALIPSSDSKEKKEKKPQKIVSKKSWFGKQKAVETDPPVTESAFATPALRSPPPEPEEEIKYAEPVNEPGESTKPENETNKPTKTENEMNHPIKLEDEQNNPIKPENEQQSKPPKPENEQHGKPPKPENEQTKPKKLENEQGKLSSPVAYATARAAVAAAAFRRLLGKSKEEIAAIKVQTVFRRFLARRTLRALKGSERLKALVQSQSVKRQAITTLRCMQTLARVQSQVRARRIRMSEENQALQRQILQKREREIDNMRSSEWDNTRRSKEELEASIQNKQEAAARRERALAYAQTQQAAWRNQTKSTNPTFMDPNNPHWGWSWLDRWMASRPWESQTPVENEKPPPVKTLTRSTSVGDMSKRLDRSPTASSSPRSPSVSSRRLAPSSPKNSNDPMQSPSPRNRRHSISNTLFREDSSPKASSPRVSSPKASSPRVSSPRSTKTKSMIPTPSGSPTPTPSPLGSGKISAATVKRRMSLSGAPSIGSGRRLSMPPKMGSGSR